MSQLPEFQPLSQTIFPPFQDFSSVETAARKLRHLADHAERRGDPGLQGLLQELLDATALVEQEIAVQRERLSHLESLSVTDELTGLLNLRGFRREVERALGRAQRRGEQGLLVLCDLDHFKRINDSYGHLAGDSVLCAVAKALRSRTRSSDYVARQGGDEFAILICDIDPLRGEAMTAAIENLVNHLPVPWKNISIPVSASLGAAVYNGDSSLTELVQRADEAAYDRKRRNRRLAAV